MKLTKSDLKALDGYFRAVNYLSVGQLYLLDNPLLQRKLSINDIKNKLVGHWGTVPGQNFIYTHLNRVINKYELTSNFLSEKIKQVVIEKKINDVSVALNSYFMYIGNHIIKMDSIINNRTNYNNYNDLVNSFNSSSDMNIILSMKFVSYKSQKHEIVQNKKEEINNEYDYSDIFPNKENIYKIFSFCYSLYDKFNSLLERQDKHQIEKGKLCGYEIFIVDNSHENKVYSNFEDFKNEFENIKNISYITLVINLQYIKLNEEYNNEFRIIIKPYNIKFNRKSNHEQVVMNQIEDSINNVMSKLRAEDTIFKN